MNCVVCKHGETRPGQVTVTLQRGATTVILKQVPAEVCENCGEAYVDEETARKLLETAEAEAGAGAQVEVREYKAA